YSRKKHKEDSGRDALEGCRHVSHRLRISDTQAFPDQIWKLVWIHTNFRTIIFIPLFQGFHNIDRIVIDPFFAVICVNYDSESVDRPEQNDSFISRSESPLTYRSVRFDERLRKFAVHR